MSCLRRYASKLCAIVFVLMLWGQCRVQAEEVVIYRDDFGTPHVFAETAEGACFGHGYSQAADRLEELLKQYRRATGTMSEAFGPEFLHDDYRQRVWQHAAIAKSKYSQLSPKSRALIEAYQAGVKLYMKEHPSEVPAWAEEIEPWMCVALSRYIIWGWPEGSAGSDLQRLGIKPDPIEYHGSNEWLVAPKRSEYNAPIALVDPHLSWYGAFRFYEARLYGGEVQVSGMSIVGMPIPAMGHSRYCSIAMTTGGPDTSDVYEEEINPANPRQYRYDGAWLDMTVRSETIRVKEQDGIVEKKVEIESTKHGPVVARKDGKAYTFRIPYAEEVQLADQTYKMITARNLGEMKQALSMMQLMEQNLMIGTVDGDIYYVRNGRVPIRPVGFDHKRAMPGNTSKAEWLGLHKFEELLQIENPPQGYMQNCNVSPQFIMKDSPLKPMPNQPWLFNGFMSINEAYDNPLHQRAAMCVELLHGNEKMTIDEAIELALSPAVFGADLWQARLKNAWESASAEVRGKSGLQALYELIANWNRRCEADSTGAVAYRYWKEAFGEEVKKLDRAGFPPPASITDPMLLAKLEEAGAKLLADFGRIDVAYGDVYRLGRKGTDRTWPASGGSAPNIATPRAISFEPIPGTKKFLGHGGQTSTQVVLLTKPPKSWTLLPLGESDHPNSPHFDDQAEKIFSKNRMKPTYFLDKEELLKHVESKTVLAWQGASSVAAAPAAKPSPPYAQTKNVVYAEVDGVGLVMDIFTPAGTPNGLGIVDVASGAFYSDRGKIEDHRRARVYDIFCGKGYTVFAVRPGSITKFGLAEMAANLKKGVAWVKDNSGTYKIDPNRLGITGGSAGGHLASLVAVTAEDPIALKAAGVFFTPTDFLDYRGTKIDANTTDGESLGRLQRFLSPSGGPPASSSELVEKLTKISPARLVTSKAPPFLIIHGDADPLVPLDQSEKLLSALRSAGVPAELIVKKGGAHPWPTIHEEVQVMADWFDKQLSAK